MVFYVVIFAACAVLLVIGGLTVWSRNRRLEAEKRSESASARERRQKNKAERSQSRKGRRKRG